MATLLILGSKPDPALPPASSFDAVACANGSGYSAAKHGLPTPGFTVMTAILTAMPSGAQTLRVIAGLGTDRLYFFPRPPAPSAWKKHLRHQIKTLRMRPLVLKWKLRRLGYGYRRFINPGHAYYADLLRTLCDADAGIMAQVQRKQPSTGVTALLLGLDQPEYDRFIISGFSFQLTHAYGQNPEIEQRGTKISKHADTDIAVISYLAKKFGNIFTTEPSVHERAEIPMLAT